MRREVPQKNILEEEWDEAHKCSFIVDVPVVVRVSVDGFNTDEVEDLNDKVESAIYEMCEVLYHNKATSFFINMERDEDFPIEVRDAE